MSITEETRTIRGACAHDCPDTCAMLVTVENGKATKVRGDPDHPFTRGVLCVKVNDYTILWACNVRSTNLHMWPFIKEAQDRGAKVVVIDPLRHRTAQSADWYIPIRPGTDGALALAMMHVIINEGLVDKDYIAQHTVGFEELSERVQQYPPDWASQVTGIPAEDIVQLAREYATTQPS